MEGARSPPFRDERGRQPLPRIAAGWEKEQAENQVGVVRERFFTPRLRVANLTN